MSATLTGLNPISSDNWDHEQHQLRNQTTVATFIGLDDDHRPTVTISTRRYIWLTDYVESVAPGVLNRRYVPPDDYDEPYFESGRFHAQDCLDVAAVLTAELETECPEAYCRQMEYPPERPPASPLNVDDIRWFRDFLCICGGYGWY